jgi:hypothetical protein
VQLITRNQEAFLKFTREVMFAERWARASHFLQALDSRAKLLCLLLG